MQTPAEIGREVADILLRLGAVAISVDKPFRYASGRTGPIYCDNRLVISFPAERRRIVEHLTAALDSALAPGAVDAVAGTATAGIPWAAWVADRADLPLVYVRAAAKDHGQSRRVEGRLQPGQRVVVVEDLVTTGGSALSTIEAIKEAGAVPIAVLAIFSYELPGAAEALAGQGAPLSALTGLPTLLEVAASGGRLAPEQIAAVRAAVAAAFAR